MKLSILAITIIIALWIKYESTRYRCKQGNPHDDFFDIESKSNSTRKKAINTLDYITFSEKSLPFIEINDELVNEYQQNLRNFEEIKCLNLSKYTNTELKLMYGPGNLAELSEYDTNFANLTKLLYKYAERLIEINEKSEAMTVLEYSVSIGSDISDVYKTLGNLYATEKNFVMLDELLTSAGKLNILLKDNIIEYLVNVKKNI